MKNLQILLIEDQLDQCAVIIERLHTLTEKGVIQQFQIDLRTNYKSATQAMKDQTYDLIIADNMIPGGSGGHLIRNLRRDEVIPKETNVILLTGEPHQVRKLEDRHTFVLEKPHGFLRLAAHIELLFKSSQIAESA